MKRFCLHAVLSLISPAMAQSADFYPNVMEALAPLTTKEMAAIGGEASCTATEGGKPIFYDAGDTIIRFHGRLLHMKPHEEMPAPVYEAADPDAAMSVFFTPRPGSIKRGEESSERPMRMRMESFAYGIEAADVIMRCES